MGVPLTLKIGDKTVAIDPDVITLRKVKDLARVVTEVRARHSIMVKYPMLEGETMDAYEERVKKELRESNVRKADESEEDFLKRLLTSGVDNQSFIFDQLKSIAELFGQGDKVTEESYDQIPYVKARKFVEDLLDMCDLG